MLIIHKKGFMFFMVFVLVSALWAEIDPFASDIRCCSENWENDFQNRIVRMVDSHYPWSIENGNGDDDAGKRAWPSLLANMWHDRHDSVKVKNWIEGKGKDLINSSKAGTFYKPFSCPGYTMYYFEYKDQLPQSQIDQAHQMIDDTGWGYMSREDHHMDPIYRVTEFNSENFNWMARLAGFLWAHEMNHQDRIDYHTNYVNNWIRALFNAGRVEWDSNVYFAYCFQPVLVLYQYAQTEKTRKQALAALDWMLITAALHYVDGFQTGPDVRAKTKAYAPFNGSTWFYTNLYGVDENYHPTFSESQYFQEAKQHYAGWSPYSDYRPPQVAVDLIQRQYRTPVEMHNAKPFYWLDNDNYADWKGNTQNSRRYEFETLYLEENYTLGSLATYRPNGNARMNTQNQMMFSEQSVWRLAVKGDIDGAVQVFGNSGDENDMAGRCPYEEIGQHKNVMMRLLKGTNTAWIAFPKNRSVTIENKMLFADMGADVYAAVIPHHASRLSNASFSTSHQCYTWTFHSLTDHLYGLVLEVGTKAQHGSFEEFIVQIKTQTKLHSPEADQLEYTSTLNHQLRMEFQSTTTYQLVDGTVINPAGVIPKVWADDVEMDYASWNAYEVVSGEKIVEQVWGSGILEAQVNGQGIRIQVDADDAEVHYKQISESGIDSKDSFIPMKNTRFRLGQNYPNPFNDTTIIEYEVLKAGEMNLQIYDMLGKRVTTLVQKYQNTGVYQIPWQADHIASGLYLCQLRSGHNEENRLLLLLK